MVNERGSEDEMESGIKEDKETSEKNIDKGLPEQEGETEKSFIQIFRRMKELNSEAEMLEECNEAVEGERKRHDELAEITE